MKTVVWAWIVSHIVHRILDDYARSHTEFLSNLVLRGTNSKSL